MGSTINHEKITFRQIMYMTLLIWLMAHTFCVTSTPLGVDTSQSSSTVSLKKRIPTSLEPFSRLKVPLFPPEYFKLHTAYAYYHYDEIRIDADDNGNDVVIMSVKKVFRELHKTAYDALQRFPGSSVGDYPVIIFAGPVTIRVQSWSSSGIPGWVAGSNGPTIPGYKLKWASVETVIAEAMRNSPDLPIGAAFKVYISEERLPGTYEDTNGETVVITARERRPSGLIEVSLRSTEPKTSSASPTQCESGFVKTIFWKIVGCGKSTI